MKSLRIGVLSSGLGNVKAVANMLNRVGATASLVETPKAIAGCDALVLPGVGAFDEGVRLLKSSGLWEGVGDYAKTGHPILGICLGMQLLANGSDEGTVAGLGLVDSHFRRFDNPELKVPHVGWNVVRPTKSSALFDVTRTREERFYFVHSYYAETGPGVLVLANAHYGSQFVCAFAQDNVLGVQFHPEKSHRFGLEFMTRFVASC